MENPVYNQKGKETGKVKMPEAVFGLKWNADLVYQVVNAMRMNARPNVAHTKMRGEVRGTGKKPWQQKGTGRARHGSRRSPIWVGGGVAHGPRNDRNFSRKINKKVRAKALHTILSEKLRANEILLVDAITLEAPKTKFAKEIMTTLGGVKGYEKLSTKKANTAIIAVDKKTPEVMRSFQNMSNVSVEEARSLNPLSVLNHKYIVIVNPEASLKLI